MVDRRYSTAFGIAKLFEILSWVVIVIGVLIGFGLMNKLGEAISIAIMIALAIPGLFLVFISQLTLIFIDTENNTRQALSEIKKTNSMLAETLGNMANNLNKLAKSESVQNKGLQRREGPVSLDELT
jgi:hypothetical protein